MTTEPGATTYEVRLWKTAKYAGKRVTTYTVVWFVNGEPWLRPHRTAAMVESLRSELMSAMRKVLDAVGLRLDGQPAAGRTVHRKRASLSNALAQAVEIGLLASNPIESIKRHGL